MLLPADHLPLSLAPSPTTATPAPPDHHHNHQPTQPPPAITLPLCLHDHRQLPLPGHFNPAPPNPKIHHPDHHHNTASAPAQPPRPRLRLQSLGHLSLLQPNHHRHDPDPATSFVSQSHHSPKPPPDQVTNPPPPPLSPPDTYTQTAPPPPTIERDHHHHSLTSTTTQPPVPATPTPCPRRHFIEPRRHRRSRTPLTRSGSAPPDLGHLTTFGEPRQRQRRTPSLNGEPHHRLLEICVDEPPLPRLQHRRPHALSLDPPQW